MDKKPLIGKIKAQQENKRGWLVGQFMEDPFKDNNVEICYKTFAVGKTDDKLHQHPIGKEYLIILQGRAIFRLGANVFEIKNGDYLAIPSNTPDQLTEVLEELTFISVRNPSVPDNKVVIED